MAKDKQKKHSRSEDQWIYRNAETGKFVSRDYAQRHPKSSVRESIPKKETGSSKRGGSRSGGPKKK